MLWFVDLTAASGRNDILISSWLIWGDVVTSVELHTARGGTDQVQRRSAVKHHHLTLRIKPFT